jgi:hypothetical protein
LSVTPISIWAGFIATIIKFKESCIANAAIYGIVGSRALFAFLRAEEAFIQNFVGVCPERAKIITFSSQEIISLSALQTSIVICIPTC